MRNFYNAAIVLKNNDEHRIKASSPRQHGIIAVYKKGCFYAKINNKLYTIENYKLTNGTVYSKPENDAYDAWTMKQFDKELGVSLTIDNYIKIERMWASLYDGQTITGTLKQGMFVLKSKTDKML